MLSFFKFPRSGFRTDTITFSLWFDVFLHEKGSLVGTLSSNILRWNINYTLYVGGIKSHLYIPLDFQENNDIFKQIPQNSSPDDCCFHFGLYKESRQLFSHWGEKS